MLYFAGGAWCLPPKRLCWLACQSLNHPCCPLQTTNARQWDKPDELKSAGEKDEGCDWTEHKTPDGRTYYHNKQTKASVWTEPKELTEYACHLLRGCCCLDLTHVCAGACVLTA